MNETQIKTKYPVSQYMPVLISEVTRMSKGRYCVAGWDFHGNKMVRPLQSSGDNWRFGTDRSIFSVGKLVNCVPIGSPRNAYPHATEDLRLASPPNLLRIFDEPETYLLLLDKAFKSLRQLFGVSLLEDKFIPEGTQCRSLGGVRIARRRVNFIEDTFGRLRLNVLDNDGIQYQLAVTCDRLKHLFSSSNDDSEPQYGLSEANAWLSETPENEDLILRVGLARGWNGNSSDWNPLRCYAQLNGILCPEDNYHIFDGQ
ncbi:MAG TPA: hypothetical protein VJ385_19010 [Fibrobacteria bacterium]|nr:hypothetical protein [Fibrobacteria bacterium]